MSEPYQVHFIGFEHRAGVLRSSEARMLRTICEPRPELDRHDHHWPFRGMCNQSAKLLSAAVLANGAVWGIASAGRPMLSCCLQRFDTASNTVWSYVQLALESLPQRPTIVEPVDRY